MVSYSPGRDCVSVVDAVSATSFNATDLGGAGLGGAVLTAESSIAGSAGAGSSATVAGAGAPLTRARTSAALPLTCIRRKIQDRTFHHPRAEHPQKQYAHVNSIADGE